MFPESDIASAGNMIAAAQRVFCICHRNPDGDAIGSLLGIAMLLERQFPDKTITTHCVDPVPDMFNFLPGAFRVENVPDALPNPDHAVFIFLDCGEPKLTEIHESHPHIFDGTYKSLMFDHHHGNPKFGTVNFLLPSASSTCEVITRFADSIGWQIDGDVATCLITGILTDTGGLLHSNTTADVYRTVARLMRAGGRRQETVTAVFRTGKMSTLRLWGRVLEKISITDEGGAVSAVTEGDFRATGADRSELTGAIDYVNAVPGMRFSLVLSEGDGKVKGSLRTMRDDVDVSAMASKFSGGGHK
ncbi:DHH family phosphoesterase, partial [Candidatus Peregrinibacteria bacterium]|nr:DHH family phosphoesterase [Candidatus Peregrinibacteria bacterium]